jgi:phosphohistidine phosphatase SixA
VELTVKGNDVKNRVVKALETILLLSITVLLATVACAPTTALVLRHAERPPGLNPSLSQEGQMRAQELIQVAGEAGVTAIYANDFCRTAQTSQPLADHLGLPINVQENGFSGDQLEDCDPAITVPVNRLAPEIDTHAKLVDHILQEHRGKVVLIVGHSHTVPQIVEALGAPSVPQIPGNEYDNLFIVTVPRWRGSPKIVKAKYGD